MDIKFYENIVLGGDGKFKGCSVPMVDVIAYDFKSLIANKVKPEESFINAYIDECLESVSTFNSTRIICRILDVKYKKADLNKVVDEQCQYLSPDER